MNVAMHSLQHFRWKIPALSVHADSPMGVAPSLECRLTPPMGRPIVLKNPMLFRQIPWKEISKENAFALCAAVRQLGGAISVPLELMEQLPATSIPLRITQIWTDRSPSLTELEMSDIIEFNFCSEKTASTEVQKQLPSLEQTLSWPIDVQDDQGLRHRIAMLREITEYKIPIGFAMPAGNVQDDIALAYQCEVDFVTLTWSPDFFNDRASLFPAIPLSDALLEVRLARTQNPSTRHNDELKIFIDSPLEAVDDFAKLFALGVDAWCAQSAIDSILRQPQTPQPNLGYNSMRPYQAPNSQRPSIQAQLMERSQKYLSCLEYVLSRLGKLKADEFGDTDLQETTR